MRPQLKPALPRIWRNPSTLQFGLDASRAVLLTGLSPADRAFVLRLDGTRPEAALLADAGRSGMAPGRAAALLEALAPVLQDAAAPSPMLARLPQSERDRLAPDLAALSLTSRVDGGVGALSRRMTATVVVHGAGRAGALVAVLLAAAGVGRVLAEDDVTTGHADIAPGGLSAEDVGTPRGAAVARAIGRIAPGTDVRRPVAADACEMAVLTAGPLLSRCDAYVQSGVPHLPVRVDEGGASIGPLVLPGASACLRCVEIGRSERDADWPRLAAQRDLGPAPSSGVVLATLAAAHTVVQVLGHLDGGAAPAAVDGTLEITMPGGTVRRRSRRPHPACGCRWAD